MKQYDVAVVIGRFQPIHNGHIEMIRHANSLADNTIIVLGSAKRSRTPRNPLSDDERTQLIYLARNEAKFSVDYITSVRDNFYAEDPNAQWISDVTKQVNQCIADIYPDVQNVKVCLVGHKKSDGQYLDWFPQWVLHESPNATQLNATDIRNFIYNRITGEFHMSIETAARELERALPRSVFEAIADEKIYKHFRDMAKERQVIANYQKPYETLPFPPIFVTVDAVCVCNGKILLIKRRAIPGKGLWALPGGFINVDEKVNDAILRELQEETTLKLSKSDMKFVKVFDEPARSQRGRTITHCGFFAVNSVRDRNGKNVTPEVQGQDDAERSEWFDLQEFYQMSHLMFEDHWDIANTMISKAFFS